MTCYLGIKYKHHLSQNSTDIDELDGYYPPMYYFKDKLPKELVDFDGYYLGNGRSGADQRIWQREFDNVVDKLLKILDGKVIDKGYFGTIIECKTPIMEDFGRYVMVNYGKDGVIRY